MGGDQRLEEGGMGCCEVVLSDDPVGGFCFGG